MPVPYITIQFCEIQPNVVQALLDAYGKAQTASGSEALNALAAVGGVEPTPAPAAPQVAEVLPERTMRDEVAMFVDRNGKDAMREVFAKLGVKKLGECPVDWYPRLRSLMDGTEA